MTRGDISSIIASYINSNGPLDYQKDINVVSERILAAVVHQEKEEGLISEFYTADLIKELEARRPICANCIDGEARQYETCNCIWYTVSDNFKPKTEEHK